MDSFKIYKNLTWFNEVPADQAEILLYKCSGSELWARQMTKMRPFKMLENLYGAADANWFSLPPGERISAFSAVSAAPGTELAKATRLYHAKFGFIFVVCASGKSSKELLAVCSARLGNSAKTELQIADEEHRKIIETRLNKLLER